MSRPRTLLRPQDWCPCDIDPTAKRTFESLPNAPISDSRQMIGIGLPRLTPGLPPGCQPLPDASGSEIPRAQIDRALRDLDRRLVVVEQLLSARAFSTAAEFSLKSDRAIADHVDMLIDAFGWICFDLERLRQGSGEVWEEVGLMNGQERKEKVREKWLNRIQFERTVGEILYTFRRWKGGERGVSIFGLMERWARAVARTLGEMKKCLQLQRAGVEEKLENSVEVVDCERNGKVGRKTVRFVEWAEEVEFETVVEAEISSMVGTVRM